MSELEPSRFVMVPRDRSQLERLCRYARRPPVAQDRLHLTAEGRVVLELRHQWADGTTHLILDPLELLERLAALTPRPRINLLLYYGVLARVSLRCRARGTETPRIVHKLPRCLTASVCRRK